MARFIIYTYQFGPIVPGPDSIHFPLDFNPNEIMAKKNELFEGLFADFNTLCLWDGKESEELPLPLEGIINKQFISFHLGDPKKVPLEKIVDGKFVKTFDTTSPHCMILIDNRKDIQRIYIEKKKAAFGGNTERIAKILEYSFNAKLRNEHLYMEIGHEYSENTFWDYIKSKPLGIKSIRFYIPYPNLSRVSDAVLRVDENIVQLNKRHNSQTLLQMDAAEGGILAGLTPDNPDIQGLLSSNARAGKYVPVQPVGQKSYTLCGKRSPLSVDLPDKMSQLTAEDFKDHLFGDNMEYIASLLGNDVRPVAQ